MSTLANKINSCSNWKQKAVQRCDENRYLRKENRRLKSERDEYKKIAKESALRVIELEQNLKIPIIKEKVDLVFIALQLFLVARIGFRATSRVLTILSKHLGLSKAPCTQTIINWVTRLSIVRVKYAHELVAPKVNGSPFTNGFIWIMDMSIGLNNRKIFTVLALKALHHETAVGAPTLLDVNCIAVVVAPSWTGDEVAECLQKLIGLLGRPNSILKDGGGDLKKALDILGGKGMPCSSIADISHAIANLLKHEYIDHPLFDVFTSAVGKVSKNLKQTILACLAPPKTTFKARFMNVHRLFKWAELLLQQSPKGRAHNGSALFKLRESLDKLPECKLLISRFNNDVGPLLECQKHLKNNGLSYKSLEFCKPIINQIQTQSVKMGFVEWTKNQLTIAKSIGLATVGMPISSDVIESLYGLSKQHGSGEIMDANRIAMRIPSLCGQPTLLEANRVLEITVAEQNSLTNSFSSITKQRREILPTPGLLDLLSSDGLDKDFSLFPESKNRIKNTGDLLLSSIPENISNPKETIQTEKYLSQKLLQQRISSTG